jgi:hypothetical protein
MILVPFRFALFCRPIYLFLSLSLSLHPPIDRSIFVSVPESHCLSAFLPFQLSSFPPICSIRSAAGWCSPGLDLASPVRLGTVEPSRKRPEKAAGFWREELPYNTSNRLGVTDWVMPKNISQKSLIGAQVRGFEVARG